MYDHIGYTEDAGPTVQPRKDKWVQPRWRSIVCSNDYPWNPIGLLLTTNTSSVIAALHSLTTTPTTKRSKCDSIRQMFVLGLNSEANGEVP